MKEKIKSLIFLICFIICAVVYFQIEHRDKNEKPEKSRFVAIELENDINDEEFDDIPDIIIETDSIE